MAKGLRLFLGNSKAQIVPDMEYTFVLQPYCCQIFCSYDPNNLYNKIA